MPNCCALNCSVGYGGAKLPVGVTLLRLPLKNEPLLRLRLKNLSRTNFQPTEYFRVFSRHFSENDCVVERRDSNPSRARQQFESALLRRGLKPDAVPHFTDLPSYFGCVVCTAVPMSGLACSSSREAGVALSRRLRKVKRPQHEAAESDQYYATYTI